MEAFGMLMSCPGGIAISTVYAYLLARWIRARSPLAWAMTAVSFVVLIALATEWLLLERFGALGARQCWGDAFVLLHLFTFFLSVPSLVNVIVLPPKRRPIWLWIGAGLLGGILFFLVANVQYSVSEAWEGPDGIGGPYSTQPTSTVAPATTRTD